MTEPIQSEPGWYPSTSRPGHQQYWDGSAWHEAYRPGSGPLPYAPHARMGGFAKFTIAMAVLVVVAVAAATVIAGIRGVNESQRGPSEIVVFSPTSTPLAAPVEPVRSAEQILDEDLLSQGFQVGESGKVYYKAMDPAETTCGRLSCVFYSVYTYVGCNEGIYFEASIETDAGVSVGQANEITASLQPEQTASVLLEDYTRAGSAFRVTEVRCMG